MRGARLTETNPTAPRDGESSFPPANGWHPNAAARTALAVVVVLIVAAARWTTRSRYFFDLDSVLYARALDHFDLRLIQPALPGYYLYILMGRLVRAVLGDANLSFVFLSALLGVLLVAALYVLGRELFDERTGAIAALLGLTGPIFWYQSSFASPRIAEGFFSAVIVWLGIRLRLRREIWAFWALVLAAAVGGGVRQQVLLYLLPFLIWATWTTPWGRRIAGGIVGLLLCLGWLIPTLSAAGGFNDYRALSANQWQSFVVGQTGVIYGATLAEALRRLGTNFVLIAVYSFFTCILGPLILVVTLRGSWRPRLSLRSDRLQALVWATVPALLFFLLIHIQQIGHLLAIAPCLVVVIARLLVVGAARRGGRILVVGVAVANLAFIFFVPSRLIADRIGTPSVATIRDRDRFIESATRSIESGPPGETLVLTSPLSYGFVEAYAPGYRYFVLPGLFEHPAGAEPSRDQRVLTNGLQPVSDPIYAGVGHIRAPASVRRFVTASVEVDISRFLQDSPSQSRDSAVPSIAEVRTPGPATIWFAPGVLKIDSVAAVSENP